MTINYNQAAEDARSLARQFKAVLSLVDVLDALGKIEQTTKEAEQRRNRALMAAEEANEVAREASDKLTAAERALAEATEAMAARKAEAEAEGKAILAEAQQRADKLTQDTLAKVRAKEGKLAALTQAETALHEKLAGLQAEIGAAEDLLMEVRGKLAGFLQ